MVEESIGFAVALVVLIYAVPYIIWTIRDRIIKWKKKQCKKKLEERIKERKRIERLIRGCD